MNDLPINNHTKLQLKSLQNDPPHALLLTGPAGIGKRAAAEAWAKQLTNLVEIVEPDEKGTIPIETIRGLYVRTRSKQAELQVIIIDHAEAMGIDAQNAFLKLLEEPRFGTIFILTAPNLTALLPTITSRLQSVAIQPIPEAKLEVWIKKQKPSISSQELAQVLFISRGRPAMAQHLLKNAKDFVGERQIMQQAKKLLAASQYERLCQVSQLIKDKAQLVITLEAMAHMTRLQIAKKPEPRWLKLADGLEQCLGSLAQNANPRAQLVNLFMLY